MTVIPSQRLEPLPVRIALLYPLLTFVCASGANAMCDASMHALSSGLQYVLPAVAAVSRGGVAWGYRTLPLAGRDVVVLSATDIAVSSERAECVPLHRRRRGLRAGISSPAIDRHNTREPINWTIVRPCYPNARAAPERK